jgi:hypothetical protein
VLLRVAEPDEDQRDHRREMVLHGNERCGWRGGTHDRGADRAPESRRDVPRSPQRLSRPVLLDGQHRELHDRAQLVEPELELGDHPEVAAPAAQGPEQVGVLVCARPHGAAVGQHDLRRLQAVDREPVHPAEPAPAAA